MALQEFYSLSSIYIRSSFAKAWEDSMTNVCGLKSHIIIYFNSEMIGGFLNDEIKLERTIIHELFHYGMGLAKRDKLKSRESPNRSWRKYPILPRERDKQNHEYIKSIDDTLVDMEELLVDIGTFHMLPPEKRKVARKYRLGIGKEDSEDDMLEGLEKCLKEINL